jgi:hypothetical protein
MTHRMSAREAFAAYKRSGAYKSLAAFGDPEPLLEFGLFTVRDYGHQEPDGSLTLVYRDKPVWLVQYLDVKYAGREIGPGGPATNSTAAPTVTAPPPDGGLTDVIIAIDDHTGNLSGEWMRPSNTRSS